MGEVLFWVLKHCLGQRVYSMATHAAWVKVYSRMLTTIVPIAIGMELKGGKSRAHQERFSSNQDSFMFSQTATSQHNSEVGSEKADSLQADHETDDVRAAEGTR